MRTLSLAPISGRRRQAVDQNALWLAPSLFVHALLFAATAVDLVKRSDLDDQRPVHEVVFLAPLIPKNEPMPDREQAEGPGGASMGWVALTSVKLDPVAGIDVGSALKRSPGLEQGVAEQDVATPPAPDFGEVGDEQVYQAVDVDREVVREPGATAPAYPESLRLTGVQGGVTAEFVVDTLGQIEAGSFHIIGSTHPLFAAAVRDATPGMHFRPAVRAGRSVRQQVIQSFQFVLQTTAQSVAGAAAKAARPDSVP